MRTPAQRSVARPGSQRSCCFVVRLKINLSPAGTPGRVTI
ncbi:hypothetical protein I545_1740 [Mycobacterium kansasii 662]|uniref:Uncharacterized protein n=1 Tax=Mycobacterium kansasii 662 TaxID=1299326 RepID=X7ZJZ6_MYCKA|nr:hypothetical protein I545_1740 [Mycobacterium kansasii 662]KEP39744.1 hypothetical protein MKSMC1_50940 [Mycobacterium kansasii]